MKKKSFKAESKRLLDLMINSIYTHKEIFLREIISNSSDALDKLHFISLTDDKVRESMGKLSIQIFVDKENRTITVSDNGVGMTEKELEENLGTIAKSGSFTFKQGEEEKEKTDIIGQFGVGFYSAFMVSDNVTVISKKYDEDIAHKWESNGTDGYIMAECDKSEAGTEIIMHIKEDTDDDNYSQYLENHRLTSLIKSYSDYIRFPIIMDVDSSINTAKDDEEPKFEKVTEKQTINSMIPIWQRNKKEVSDKDCAEYYMEKFGDNNEPIATIRVDAEGVVSYKAMMFIPASLPYGYYTKDFEKGLQLYSRGVLIMDKCDQLLPEHFRFVRGIVDSPDLSLNISRELLQHDRQLQIISKNIEKKINAELKKLLVSNYDKYKEFWKVFGLQLKYGVVSDYGMHKETLSDLLLFYSSSTGDLTTLKDYVSRMTEEQKYIYYACGSSVESIAELPQIEKCKDKGYEMLYLTDEIDEFAMQTLMTFEEKQLKAVNAEDAGLQSDEEKEKTKQETEENSELLTFIKESLSDKVGEVVISDKLKSHPVCLSAKGPITLEMEKYFAQMPGDENKPKATRVLELNSEHSAFKALKSAYENDKEKAKKYAEILYSQSLLIAGLPVEDVVRYCDTVCDLIK